ncbi:CML6 [Symbiodinium sp. KB8]|nr:CML6 [Symbiodinium sp. KB8]
MFSLGRVLSLCVCHEDTAEVSSEVFFQSVQGDFSAVEVSPQCTAHKEQLDELFRSRPYLVSKEHELAFFIDELVTSIASGNADEAQNNLDILQMKLDLEEKHIAAAFNKFDHSGDGVLAKNEVTFMLDYLGFPDTQEDVDKLMSIVDTSRDGTIQFDEFLRYVGKVGGTGKLFEIRRQQIKERGGFKGSISDPDNLRVALQECGINPESQAHWRLTASESELAFALEPAMAMLLNAASHAAIRHIRNLAQENHERALPELQRSSFASLTLGVQNLGHTDTELWMVLAWIRELAPLIVHINLDKVGQFFMKDTHYRNQFETKTSGGLLKTSAREKWERGLFGTAYDDAKPAERPKYGVQNIWNDPRGVVGARQYGDSYIVLKDFRLRCTLSPQDSANLPARKLAVLDYYAHVLLEYSDKELKEAIRVAEKGDEKVGDSEMVVEKWGMYKEKGEAQLHGEIDLRKHVDRLVANERHRKQADWVKKLCKKNGWTLTWMDDMRTQLEDRQSGVELDVKQWLNLRVVQMTDVTSKANIDWSQKALLGWNPPHPLGVCGDGWAVWSLLLQQMASWHFAARPASRASSALGTSSQTYGAKMCENIEKSILRHFSVVLLLLFIDSEPVEAALIKGDSAKEALQGGLTPTAVSYSGTSARISLDSLKVRDAHGGRKLQSSQEIGDTSKKTRQEFFTELQAKLQTGLTCGWITTVISVNRVPFAPRAIGEWRSAIFAVAWPVSHRLLTTIAMLLLSDGSGPPPEGQPYLARGPLSIIRVLRVLPHMQLLGPILPRLMMLVLVFLVGVAGA